MSEFRLRTYDVSPPGGYPFHEEGPKPRSFHAEPVIEAQARTLLGYRKGNSLPRASYAECLQDVDRYTCKRLGNNPLFCVSCESNSTAIAVAANAPGLQPCSGCGAKV